MHLWPLKSCCAPCQPCKNSRATHETHTALHELLRSFLLLPSLVRNHYFCRVCTLTEKKLQELTVLGKEHFRVLKYEMVRNKRQEIKACRPVAKEDKGLCGYTSHASFIKLLPMLPPGSQTETCVAGNS